MKTLDGSTPDAAPGPMLTREDVIQGTPPTPPSARSEVPIPEALDRIVLSCLAQDPAERPQARELSRQLANVGGANPGLTIGRGIGGRRTGPRRRWTRATPRRIFGAEVQGAMGMLERPGDGKPDDLDPARGVLAGVLLGVVLWALLIATCFAVVRR